MHVAHTTLLRQDVQLKWQSFSFLRSIQSSRFLRTTLTPAQAERVSMRWLTWGRECTATLTWHRRVRVFVWVA